MWNYTKQNQLLKELYLLDRSLKKLTEDLDIAYLEFAKTFKENFQITSSPFLTRKRHQ